MWVLKMFLKLKQIRNGKYVRIHVDRVCTYESNDENQTQVHVSGAKYIYVVQETPEEIDQLLHEAYITIKNTRA